MILTAAAFAAAIFYKDLTQLSEKGMIESKTK